MAGNCRVTDCPRDAQRRRHCWTHYGRIKKYGGPGPAEYIGKWASLEERFYDHVQVNGPIPPHAPRLGACHIWTGHTVNGYGRIGNNHKQLYAHRLAYEWANGPIPIGRQITQRCRNTLCVRADHLELRAK